MAGVTVHTKILSSLDGLRPALRRSHTRPIGDPRQDEDPGRPTTPSGSYGTPTPLQGHPFYPFTTPVTRRLPIKTLQDPSRGTTTTVPGTHTGGPNKWKGQV